MDSQPWGGTVVARNELVADNLLSERAWSWRVTQHMSLKHLKYSYFVFSTGWPGWRSTAGSLCLAGACVFSKVFFQVIWVSGYLVHWQ